MRLLSKHFLGFYSKIRHGTTGRGGVFFQKGLWKLFFLFYLNDMCFRLKSCCHFLKLRNHFLYALLSYGCALTTNNSPVLQLCVTICCASLSLSFAYWISHIYVQILMKSAYACTFFVPSFQGLEKKQLGGRKETKIWARFSTPSPPPVNRAKEKHLSWKMWRERGAPERLLRTLLIFRHKVSS